MTRTRTPRSLPLRPRAPSSSCDSVSSLYSFPLSSDTLSVYSPLTLTWNPACVRITTSSTIDLYLNVQTEEGLVAVHEWTDVDYEKGELETMLKPGWWNASEGAGEVKAQLGIVPSGQPIWNTPAPSGPLFTVSYNGSYPSVTDTAPTSIYTGPSVESVADKNGSSSTPTSGGKLGAAIGVPLVVVAAAVVGYVMWNKWRKRPQKKRFSAVVDQRMSMMSQGTWQPRPSMASRPGSMMHPSSSLHRPSGSMYSTGNRHSYFADPTHNRQSTYSALNAGGGGSPLRPPQPAEMRQRGIGEGDRVSRVSFAGAAAGERERGGHGKSSSIYTRSSMYQSVSSPQQTQLSKSQDSTSSNSSSPHHSPPLSRSTQLVPSLSSTSLVSTTSTSETSSRFEDPISRSGTTEELRDSPSVNNALSSHTRPYAVSHSHKPSATSSLRNELSSPSDPFASPSPSSSSRPKLSPLSTTPSFLSAMPQLASTNSNEGILSPDQALASYSFTRALSPAPPTSAAAAGTEETIGGGGGLSNSRIQGSGSVKVGLGKMLRKFKSSGSLKGEGKEGKEDEREKERSRSPFEDPVIPPIPALEERGAEGAGGGMEWYGDEDEKRGNAF